jgi:hypothetical protein
MNAYGGSMRNTRFGWIGTFGLGALLVYIFDPHSGRRRRAVMRDKVTRLGRKTFDAIDVTSRDLKNRVAGLSAQAKNLVTHPDVSDDVLI